ncbi:MAG: Transglutaminase-like enzyme, putative cysteine protease [Candidatus Methanocomedens sp.]|nr:MAG: Transglutaminase-like enzyme, putative cysteine protease [ANME-2 cluster archaeon]
MKKQNIWFAVILIICALLISGCIEQETLTNVMGDPVVKRAEPYISEIIFEDMTLRAQSSSIVSECPSGDKECQINELYRFVIDDFSYYSDPRKEEFIQTPYETLDIHGGDCEDLTILLMSLLENLGVQTYLVLTPDHAYCLACDVDTEHLLEYIGEPILAQYSKDLGQTGHMNVVMENGNLYILEQKQQTFTLQPGYIYYYGGDGSKFNSPIEYMDIQYDVASSNPLNVYVVPSRADYELMVDRLSYEHYPSCQNLEVIWTSDKCNGLTTHGGVVFENRNKNEAIVDFDIRFYFYYSPDELLEDQQISYYEIDGKNCVVLDATAGKYGYPGYDGNPEGEKIAIDPLTKEYFYLE